MKKTNRVVSFFLVLFSLYSASISHPSFAGPDDAKDKAAAEIQAAADDADKAIVAEAGNTPEAQASAAVARVAVHSLADQVTTLEKKGLLSHLKGLSGADKFRYALAVAKMAGSVYVALMKSKWNLGAVSFGAGAGGVFLSGATQVGATAREFQINETFQNFPIPLRKFSEKSKLRLLTAVSQNSLGSAAVFGTGIPFVINSFEAINERKALPSIMAAMAAFFPNFVTSFLGSSAYEASKRYVKANWISESNRNVGFALLGLYGWYAGLQIIQGGGTEEAVAHAANLMKPLWATYGVMVAGSLLAKQKAKKENSCGVPLANLDEPHEAN